jgi:PAS domain S-box-containing protein
MNESQSQADDDDEKLAMMAVMNCGTPLAILHMHGNIIESNIAMCEALGYTQIEMRAKTIYEVTLPEDLAELMKNLCSLLTAPEGTCLHKAGVRLLHRQGHYVAFNLDLSAQQVCFGSDQGRILRHLYCESSHQHVMYPHCVYVLMCNE